MTRERDELLRVGVLGAGGLGRAAVRVLEPKTEMRLVAIADSRGFAFDPHGLDGEAVLQAAQADGSVAATPEVGGRSEDAIGDLIDRGGDVDAFFVALPNLPNAFIPSVVERFAKSGYGGVMTDALKRTGAVELMMKLDALLEHAHMTYVVGAGATPGLLTAAASLAAQSFTRIESVKIVFGVGIANWEEYRATIREDMAHLPGFDMDRAASMTDAEIEHELDRRDGVIELVDMEHADDVILESAGVVDRGDVTVGGVVDTRHAEKPISTNVQITGTTFEGKRSTHTFTLGDETSMAANVCGPAFGYLKAASWLHGLGAYGVFSSATVMPHFVH